MEEKKPKIRRGRWNLVVLGISAVLIAIARWNWYSRVKIADNLQLNYYGYVNGGIRKIRCKKS